MVTLTGADDVQKGVPIYDIVAEGVAVTVTGYDVVVKQPADTVSVTVTEKLPAVGQLTVMLVPVGGGVIFPPVTVHAYVWPPIGEIILYTPDDD
jgi:hypothetical protein